MSSTRTAKDDSVFHQARYASSSEFERGLIANLVAKRCALLDAKADRELIWFIQHLSHQDGGLAALAEDLMEKFPDRIQTQKMIQLGVKPGMICDADKARAIRDDFSDWCRNEWSDGCSASERSRAAMRALMSVGSDAGEFDGEVKSDLASYPAQEFINQCRADADHSLAVHLGELCLNPVVTLKSGPWYFPSLIETLHEYQVQFILAKSRGVVTTALGKAVCEILDYTAYSRGLTLVQGEARLGKTFSARAWCEQHPGKARFVEVPVGNDESTFFRALARGLGLGNFLNYKVGEIKSRVESVLLTGDILLVLDEAQRLWPQMNSRYGSPKRIEHIMSWANTTQDHPAVPMCLISTPQFTQSQIAMGKNSWNSAQLTGRTIHYESLPTTLSKDDLMAVAKSVLPEANAQVLRALAVYASSSERYLAAIDAIAKRARYLAMRTGRHAATDEDVRTAMQESVIPADTKLRRALESGRDGKLGKMTPAPMAPLVSPEPPRTFEREPAECQLAGNRIAQPASALYGRVPEASLIEA